MKKFYVYYNENGNIEIANRDGTINIVIRDAVIINTQNPDDGVFQVLYDIINDQ